MPNFRICITERVIVTRSAFVTIAADTATLAKEMAEANEGAWEPWDDDSTEAETMPRYQVVAADGVEDMVGGFAIVPWHPGFKLIDCDTFNSWSSASQHTFSSREAAADYAARCHDFKRGRIMDVGPYEPTTANVEG